MLSDDAQGVSRQPPAAPRGTVDLWLWHLDIDEAEAACLAAILAPDEIARARGFVFPLHARRFVAGRARLRLILQDYVGRPAAGLAFAYGPQGKPSLARRHGSSLHFNLSHTGNLAALAVSAETELGVDVERIAPMTEDVAGRFFSAAERAALAALPAAERERGFFQCWTRKEAMIKALGGGLSIALDSFDVTLTPGAPARLLRLAGPPDAPARLLRLAGQPDAPARWSLLHFEPEADCVGAVAVPMRQCALVLKSSTSG